MSEVKDPAIKLFGRTIPLPLIISNDSSSSSPSSSPPEFISAIQQEVCFIMVSDSVSVMKIEKKKKHVF